MKTYGIPVNGLTIENHTGVEKYAVALIGEMMAEPLYRDETVILYSSKIIDEFDPLPFGWQWKIIKWPFNGWTHARLSLEMLKAPPSVLFIPAHETPLLYRRTKIVNTVHDLAFKIYSKSYSFWQNVRQRFSVWRVAQSSRIIAISEATKKDLEIYYQIDEGKISVVRHGINVEDFKADDFLILKTLQKYDLKDRRFFITVGRIEDKKNIGLLVEAFEKYRESGGTNILVLAGKFVSGQDHIKQKIKNSKSSDYIRTPGYVPDEDLPGLLAGSAAYLFPSKYEGFGLPALEAMAAGTPVLASNIPALREVAGTAALYADVGDSNAWAQNMRLIAEELNIRAALVERGNVRLKDFSWNKSAKETWRVLRSV